MASRSVGTALVGAALLSTACASVDMPAVTRVEATGPARWRYISGANATYLLDSQRAEAIRLGWLDRSMRRNCPGGYEVTGRQPVFKLASLGIDVYDVVYDVSCHPT